MKIAEIRELATDELAERIRTEKASYTQMLLNHSVSPLENTARIRTARRDIARMMTVLRERELNN